MIYLTDQETLVIEETVREGDSSRVTVVGGAKIGDNGGEECGIGGDGVEKEVLPHVSGSLHFSALSDRSRVPLQLLSLPLSSKALNPLPSRASRFIPCYSTTSSTKNYVFEAFLE
ncbi:hypothetical protein QYF36_026875 [Acer negundo]|nr:hypothetical protein QYF36_026875 [Acer negundo]